MDGEMSAFEISMVRHAIGLNAPRGVQGYRNHYSATDGSESDVAWRSMCERGLAERVSDPPLPTYRATAKACRLAGASEAATIRATGTAKQIESLRVARERGKERHRRIAEAKRRETA